MIVAVFFGVYLVAVFVGSLALLRMKRENQELRDRLEAIERERHRLHNAVRSSDAEP
jgi:hypothetical protein